MPVLITLTTEILATHSPSAKITTIFLLISNFLCRKVLCIKARLGCFHGDHQ